MEQENNLAMYNFPTEDRDSETEVSLDLEDELYDNVPFHFVELSPESKAFLTLPSADRNNYNSQKVLVELDKLDFFQKFPNKTKQKLCKKITYGSFQDKDYLLRQCDDVMNMYVLLSGVVAVRYNILVPTVADGAETQWPERVLRSGDYFGHSDLLRSRPSTVDAYAVGYCEVLMLDADDFEIVRRPLKAEQLHLKMSLHSTKVLKRFNWSHEELNALEMFAKFNSYLETVEIYNGSEGTTPKWSHFLVTGECMLSREVSYYDSDFGTSEIRFKAAQVGERHQKILKTDLHFQNVQQGYFFGVGEDFGGNRVLANPASECLSVMRLVLVFKNWKLLQEMAEALTQSLPSDQALLDDFFRHEAASGEVKDMIEDMMKDKPARVVDGEQANKKPPFKKFV